MSQLRVPFFRPELTAAEIDEVVAVLRSGWLTTGPRVRQFEQMFATAVKAPHAIAVNSCTAALHLAVEALGLKAGEAVLVPTLTFAATAEVVRYQGAVPILVDCDPRTRNMDLGDAALKIEALAAGRLPAAIPRASRVVGIIPVHVGGLMLDIAALRRFSRQHSLWLVEDAAHSFPAAWRANTQAPWQLCGEDTADVTCFSFYTNKTITTGEGGMATTTNPKLAEQMRMMSLHGLSRDAWDRYATGGTWDYQILAPGFKYNLTDVAAALGLGQLARAEEMRRQREAIAHRYRAALGDIAPIELPADDLNRIHSWHLFPLRLRRQHLAIHRNQFAEELKQSGVAFSVHWRPLHLHPYYQETYGWRPQDLPIATAVWEELLSLPIFPAMRTEEVEYVIQAVRSLCDRHAC